MASRGHNLLITGQAGTGKSTVAEEIISNLNAVGLKVAVVCSGGIACTVCEPGKASTVHSHYGLGVAGLPWQRLERSTNNIVVVKRVSESDVLIWDEVSTSSQRMLEIVNAIHHRLSENGHKTKPFAKKRFLNSIFLCSLYLSRDWSYITEGRQNAPVGSWGKSKIFNGKF